MSLQVDDTGRRDRSRSPAGRSSSTADIARSPSGRDRDRDRSRDPLGRDEPSIAHAPYPGDDDDDVGGGRRRPTRIPDYEGYRTKGDRSPRTPSDESKARQTKYDSVEGKRGDGRRDKEYRYEKDEDRDRGRDRDMDKGRQRLAGEDKLSFLPAKYAMKAAPAGKERETERERGGLRSSLKKRNDSSDTSEEDEIDDDDLAYGSTSTPVVSSDKRAPTAYAYNLKHHEYTTADTYVSANQRGHVDKDSREDINALRDYLDRHPEQATVRDGKHYRQDSYGRDPRSSGSNILTVEPGRRSGRDKSPGPAKEMARLSVSTLSAGNPHHSPSMSLSAAPGSPLLESYRGTYQSMSPMPSPMLLASQGSRASTPTEAQMMDITGPESDDERFTGGGGSGGGGDKIRRRARFYDPETDAQRLAKALRGERHAPDVEPLIEVLPGLAHEQVMELRSEYKRIVKTGPERRGVNLAKHIKARLKDEDPALMKVCYATALGKWESEAYWANFWYHGDKTRRELLIESLMGRTNDEIHQIKHGFSDKKYGDSLTKCMRTELKEDKFKRAVLFVLDEQRMDEFDRDGRPLPVDTELVREDAVSLYRAVHSERGGETATINVVVQRSDTHLREVLRLYSSQYESNFARDCLRKSGNLVV